MASFEESFSRAFNTSLTSTQQQMPRLLKMQQDMRDKMDEKQRHDAALNTFNGMIANLDGVTAEGSAKQVVGVQDGQKILDVYQNIIELPDELRRDKQTIAKTFRSETGFDPSEVFLTNVTKRDPIDLQVELDIFREDTVNGRVTAGQIRKIIKDPGTSARLIASTKGRQPGRINSPQQTEALFTIDKAERYLAGLNAIESKLAQHPDFEIMKPRLEAIRERVMGQIELADESFKRDMDRQELALQRQKFAASVDPRVQGRLAGAEEGAKIDARTARSADLAATAGDLAASQEFGRVTGRGLGIARLMESDNPTERTVGEKMSRVNVQETTANPVIVKATENVLEDLALKKQKAANTRDEIALARSALESGRFEPGAFGDFRLAAASVGKLFGFDTSVIPGLGDPTAGQIIDRANVALAFEKSLEQGGRISNERIRLLRKIFVSVDMDADAARLMIETMERKVQQDELLWREGMNFVAGSDAKTLTNEKGETVIDHLDRVAKDFPVVTDEMQERISGVTERLDKIREKLGMAEDNKITKSDVKRALANGRITKEDYVEINLELNLPDIE